MNLRPKNTQYFSQESHGSAQPEAVGSPPGTVTQGGGPGHPALGAPDGEGLGAGDLHR